MTMHTFYTQLVAAQHTPAAPLAPLARLMRGGLAQARQLRSALEWVAW